MKFSTSKIHQGNYSILFSLLDEIGYLFLGDYHQTSYQRDNIGLLDSIMAQRKVYWLDHTAFCRRHDFDHTRRDYEQVRGSVSVILEGFLVDLMLIFRTHPWLCS